MKNKQVEITRFKMVCEKLGMNIPNVDLKKVFISLDDDAYDKFIDEFMEIFSEYAKSEYFVNGKHYRYIDDKLHIDLNLCINILRRFESKNYKEGILGKSIKQIFRNKCQRGGYIIETGKQIDLDNRRPRCIVIDVYLISEKLDFVPPPGNKDIKHGGK